MKKLILATLLCLGLAACSEPRSNARAVYLLLDTSGTYTAEMDTAQKIMNYLLATLDSGDSIAIARIDSGSFSEKDIIAKVTFDDRPSSANQQKRMFKDKIDEFVANTKRGSRHTDITGGMLQASEYLEETGAGERYVLGGENLTWAQLHRTISELCGINGPLVTTSHTGAYLVATAAELAARLRGRSPATTRAEAKMVGRYYWYSHDKAAALGYRPRPAR